jgi:hypothetical protein
LDKGCTDAKFLKLAEGKDFSTEFEKARTAATEAANKTPNKADYFAPWLKAWQPPTGVSFVKRNPADPNKGALVNAGGQEARTIKESVSNMNELYKRLAKGIAPSGNVQGLDNSQQKAITEKFDTYFKQKSKEAAPSMGTIEFINKGKGSAVLRTAAIEVLKAKRQKLQDAQYGTAQSPPKQQNNKIVLEYLALYLQGMGCGL